jgi:hypothetical protein
VAWADQAVKVDFGQGHQSPPGDVGDRVALTDAE